MEANLKKSVGLRVNVTPAEYAELERLATKQERSVASLVRLGIRCLFEQQPQEEGSSR